MRMRRIISSSVACSALPFFSHYCINGTVFGRGLLNITRVLIFFITFLWNISYSKKNSARNDHKCTYVLTQNIRYSCHVLMKLEFSRQNFEKYSNIKFHKNPSSGNRVVRHFANVHNQTGYTVSKRRTVFGFYHLPYTIAECSPHDVNLNFLYSKKYMFTFIFTRILEPTLQKSSLEVGLPHDAQ
jgi:hypothetical protein